MIDLQYLKISVPQIDFREKRVGLYKVIIPFYYEDGDMYDVFVETSPVNDKMIRISDYGLTIMKLSYSFNINSKTKEETLQSIISQNRCFYDDGNIYLDIYPNQFNFAIYQFIQAVSKVSNLTILSRENIKSLFFEHLNEFIQENLTSNYEVLSNYRPVSSEQDIVVDYYIKGESDPIYLYGVNSNEKASKVIISCMNFNSMSICYRSLIICESFDELSKFNQKRLINTVDKQYSDLNNFKGYGLEYIERHAR